MVIMVESSRIFSGEFKNPEMIIMGKFYNIHQIMVEIF